MTSLLIFFGILQLIRLLDYGETIIVNSVRDAHFDTDKIMSSDDDFNLAFAITAYDANREPIDDPRYGRLVSKMVAWGFSDTQGVELGGYLDIHNCT